MFEPHSFFIVAFAIYFLAFFFQIAALLRNKIKWQVRSRQGVWLGFAFHLVGMIQSVFQSGHFLLTHPSETYAFLSFLIILFHLGISLRYRVMLLALFTLPLVLFLMLAAHLATAEGGGAQMLSGYWLSLHVSLTLIAYGAFALACVSGLGYLIQDKQLKSHHPGKVFRWMPPLAALDEINTRALVFGFLMLTLGLLSGSFWAHSSGNAFWVEDPKVACAVLIWFLYAVLMSLRLSARLRGRKVALGSVFGFALVIVSFIGISHTIVQ